MLTAIRQDGQWNVGHRTQRKRLLPSGSWWLTTNAGATNGRFSRCCCTRFPAEVCRPRGCRRSSASCGTLGSETLCSSQQPWRNSSSSVRPPPGRGTPPSPVLSLAYGREADVLSLLFACRTLVPARAPAAEESRQLMLIGAAQLHRSNQAALRGRHASRTGGGARCWRRSNQVNHHPCAVLIASCQNHDGPYKFESHSQHAQVCVDLYGSQMWRCQCGSDECVSSFWCLDQQARIAAVLVTTGRALPY
mmetsp:Transcript_7/g.20  ORF Transcript_7/g.20 Transcript_7/m.20 type:complete len:249 (+) Transcript_7:232-978(+)